MATRSDRAATERPPYEVHLSVYTEKAPGEGEDCEPLVMVGRQRCVLAVFDGMGGAGGTVYDTPAGRHSGAWFASRAALDIVQGHLPEIVGPGPDLDGPQAAEVLRERLREGLARRLAEFGAAKSSLRSKLLRALPTTMALAYLVRTGPDGSDWTCHCFWAGDSRVYAIAPEAGAQQLTTDDLRSDHDALQNLVDDAVMDNCISADTDFRINYRRLELSAPFILLAATDGCFGYLPSPMHFEHLVLSTLDAAASVDAWRAGLRRAFEEVAGDDATMALIAVGGDIETAHVAFRPRLEHVRTTYIAPLNDVDEQMRTTAQRADELKRQRVSLRSELWSRYKPGYERWLVRAAPAPETALAPAAEEPGAQSPPFTGAAVEEAPEIASEARSEGTGAAALAGADASGEAATESTERRAP